ncbi:MAG: Eco57I restriction-modification methylase domain-containing protein [Bacteroidetes bacterium]|nr:Eco57I restriction-modification methylase domain-containing protein [Bacteroidota bacterium]
MTEKELKEKLHKPYHLDIWQEIVRIIFTRSDFFLSSAYQPLLEGVDFVQKAFQFGVVTLADEKRLALVDVQLTDNKVIARNRVELRNLAAKLIDSGQFEGLLVLFHANQQKDYRFSFISKSSTFNDEGELITTQTATKRYSFLLGPNESCTTAARRLMELRGNKNTSTIEAVTNAFSVEKLNKDFFKGYKEHYEKFWHYLKNKTEYYDILKDGEQADTNKTEKPIRDFAKKLLGRIVFLYFLQKKGWMGSPPALDGGVSVWANGDSNFIKNLFQYFPEKQHFYSKCLTQLFFETLNTKRDGHLFTPIGGRGTVLVPYLNGGLFDNDQPHTNHIDFPESYFADLFEFFDQYNFTIDENSPDDANVGIDPEMLGHIFENLLEENKDKGAFYTPKEIVQYICQEALIQYLKSSLTAAADRPDGGTDVEAIQSFIRNGERGEAKGFIVKNARKIETLLDEVKICDPAIGSGAFPMGMLQEIFKAKMTLDLTLDPADTKRHIIQNSIYGVDLERGAVDIARLRFWLALVVDEETPSPLPNLDYKIMQGNSLLESFEGIDLSKIHQQSVQVFEPQRDLFGNLTQSQMTIFQTQQTQDLQKLIDEYFGVENTERKHSLRKQINQAVHDHIEYNIELRERHLDRRIAEAGKPENLKPKTRKEYDKLVAEQQQVAQSRQRLHDLQDRTERPYFLWHLYFKDVFSPSHSGEGRGEVGGFDIVIGNPPYVQLAKLKDTVLEKAGYLTYEKTGDLYCLFYELGLRFLKQGGVLSFITSNSWLQTQYGQALRTYFVRETNPLILLNFTDTQLFETAVVEANILLTQKAPYQNQLQVAVLDTTYQRHTPIADFVNRYAYPQTDLPAEGWSIGNQGASLLKTKIEAIGKKLTEWDVRIDYGIKTGYNAAFIIDEATKNRLIAEEPHAADIIKPTLRGRDLKRYSYTFGNQWMISTFPAKK